METLLKVVPFRESVTFKRVAVPTEVPVACVDVAAFVRSLYEPEILATIEAIQEDTLDD